MKLLNIFIWIYANIDLWLAIQKAEKAYRGEYVIGENADKSPRYLVKNTRYYVMPDENSKLIIMHRRNMHRLRVKGVMSNEAKVKHLLMESFYFTPDGSGNKIPDGLKAYKRKKYIEYSITMFHRRREEKRRMRLLSRKIKKIKNKHGLH